MEKTNYYRKTKAESAYYYKKKIKDVLFTYCTFRNKENIVQDIIVEWTLRNHNMFAIFQDTEERVIDKFFTDFKRKIEREHKDSILVLDYPSMLKYRNKPSKSYTKTKITIQFCFRVEPIKIEQRYFNELCYEHTKKIEELNFLFQKYLYTFVSKKKDEQEDQENVAHGATLSK